jgi:BirA family transcriptional regulator, biotin operon repressor / biotin---[acetyl-CoA-carboxylase] ligase
VTTHDATSILVTWDGHTAGALAHRCGVPRVELFAETDSTLDVAHLLAEDGAPAGTVILADVQRAGRGRFGRTWSSHAGRGVWCTVIERPRDASALDVLSIRVGLRAAEALDAFAVPPERVGVKWPNDLVLQAGKLGGILTEARWSGSSVGWVAVGVGINVVAPPDVDSAAGLRDGVQRTDVLSGIVRAVRAACAAAGALTPDEMRRYAARDTLVGRRIVAPGVGTVSGIDSSGALLVETPRGSEPHRAGTIVFAGEREEGHS